MNYQKTIIKSNGFIKEIFYDSDSKRTPCRDCGELIRFGQDESGKYYPLSSDGKRHLCVKREKGMLENRIESEERNQELLNNL